MEESFGCERRGQAEEVAGEDTRACQEAAARMVATNRWIVGERKGVKGEGAFGPNG